MVCRQDNDNSDQTPYRLAIPALANESLLGLGVARYGIAHTSGGCPAACHRYNTDTTQCR